MIPLTDFAYRRVLDGARVSIADVRSCPDRLEWLCDRLLTQLPDGKWWTADVDWHVRYLALDPTDPDVARLIDRRIAGRVADITFDWALLSLDADGRWSIFYGTGTRWQSCGLGHLIDVPETPSNTNTARAALLCALYPPEPR